MINDLVGDLPASWPQLGGLVTILGYLILRDRRKDREAMQRDKEKAAHEAKRDKQLTEVHEQTVNTHPPDRNLRDDMDKSISVGESAAASGAVTVRMLSDLRDEVREGFKRIEHIERDIGGMREEMRTERTERIEGDRWRRGD